MTVISAPRDRRGVDPRPLLRGLLVALIAEAVMFTVALALYELLTWLAG